MHIIVDIDTQTFSLDGITYLKNYISRPYGSKMKIYNNYDNSDVLVDLTAPNEFTVDGAVYEDVADLQLALLPVLFYRNTLLDGGGSSGSSIRPGKVINVNTPGYVAGVGGQPGTYTLQLNDEKAWLIVNFPSAVNIKVPNGIFPANSEFEGESVGVGIASFTYAAGITLTFGASELPKVAERYSVFGLKFKTITIVSLFGKLALQ